MPYPRAQYSGIVDADLQEARRRILEETDKPTDGQEPDDDDSQDD